MTRLLIVLVGAVLWGCAGSVPPDAQLATACNQVATLYREAAIMKTAGTLPAAANTILASLATQTAAKSFCDPTAPPTDLTGALSALQAIINNLATAGVK